MSEVVHQDVKEYYGKTVRKTEDLLTNVCTVGSSTFSTEAKEAMKMVHPDVLAKNYGCGAVYPEAVEGCHVLDLGSGAGIDCFVLSKLVGQNGHVVGVDMTQEQLDIARKYIGYHTEMYGYSEPNVEFREAYIENLNQAGLKDESFDLIVSNCVVNLSTDKTAVLREAFRVLKPGGEMYFSDVYCSQPIPEELRKNKVLWGECLSGALQWRELVQIATGIGFAPPILVKSIVFELDNLELKEYLESAGPDVALLKFCSATYRLIKPVKPFEDLSKKDSTTVEVKYNGTIKGCERGFQFSFHGTLKKDVSVTMATSTAALLQSIPRFSSHFTVGDPVEDSKDHPEYPPIGSFLETNPFQVTSEIKVVDGDGPKSGTQGCCSATATSKSCC